MSSNIPDIWGGIECSYVRTNNKYGDQLHYSGHYRRGKLDLHQIACLGVKTLRYPIIWERNWQSNNWLWVESQLNILKRYEITPIVGLVHHGCGPNHATLSEPAF